MTTGRINQVAFLADGPAPHGRGRGGGGRRSHAASVGDAAAIEIGAHGRRGAPCPHGLSASGGTGVARAPAPRVAREGERGAERGRRYRVRPTPRRPWGRAAGTEPQVSSNRLPSGQARSARSQPRTGRSPTRADRTMGRARGAPSLHEQGPGAPEHAERHSRAHPHARPGTTAIERAPGSGSDRVPARPGGRNEHGCNRIEGHFR